MDPRNRNKILLSDETFQRFNVARAFKDKCSSINGIDWDREGDSMIVSADDETVHYYKVSIGDVHKVLHSRKYGVDMVRFVDRGSRFCVSASESSYSNIKYAVRLWDLWENKYLRYFRLAAGVVKGTGLVVSPKGDGMLVACKDGTIRLFALAQDTCIKIIQGFDNKPVAAFDPGGSIFCAYLGNKKLHLFDCNDLALGEFISFNLADTLVEPDECVESLTFSPDGLHILISTNYAKLKAISSVTGESAAEYQFKVRGGPCGYPSYTPDGEYVVCGASDTSVYIWNRHTCNVVKRLFGHPGVPLLTQFNPVKAILATACINVLWWHP